MRDGDIITGGGVTAGIDFALVVAAELAGAEVAQALQLDIEYAPAPPFDAGRPGNRAAGSVGAGAGATGEAVARAARGRAGGGGEGLGAQKRENVPPTFVGKHPTLA